VTDQPTRPGHANREACGLAQHLEHLAGERSTSGADVQWLLDAAATIADLVEQVDAIREELAGARKDAADLALVRALLDKHDVVWTDYYGTWRCWVAFVDGDTCGTGATRSEALIDLARRWAASDDTTPAGKAGEEIEL
jgi:hypothetical protein